MFIPALVERMSSLPAPTAEAHADYRGSDEQQPERIEATSASAGIPGIDGLAMGCATGVVGRWGDHLYRRSGVAFATVGVGAGGIAVAVGGWAGAVVAVAVTAGTAVGVMTGAAVGGVAAAVAVGAALLALTLATTGSNSSAGLPLASPITANFIDFARRHAQVVSGSDRVALSVPDFHTVGASVRLGIIGRAAKRRFLFGNQ